MSTRKKSSKDDSFVMVPMSIIMSEDLDAMSMWIWITIRSFARSTSTPSHAEIAKRANVSLSTVRRSIKTLEEAGYIQVDQVFADDGGRLSNHYTLKGN